MSTARRVWLAILALVVGAVLLSVSFPRLSPRGPLTTNARAEGIQAAWMYLDARGWDVRTWKRSLRELPPDGEGVLVLAVPAARPYGTEDLDAVRRWLMVGGDVVLLLDGTASPGAGGWQLLEGLDVELGASWEEEPEKDEEAASGADVDAAPPGSLPAGGGTLELPEDDEALTRALRQEILLEPTEDAIDGPVHLRRPRVRVRADPDERWLLRSDDGRVGVRIRRAERGRLAVVDDRSLLMNGWFARPGSGNPAAVESLLAALDADKGILYDEWHLGIEDAASAAPTDPSGRRALDVLLGHLLFIYLGIAWALGRRFGPVRPADPPPRTSVERDLRALGTLHTRAGHATALGQRLLDLAHRRARTPLSLPETFSGGPADLVALAREIAALQAEGRL